MELTRESTAIVLDSTSDFVDARERHPNMRIVPLYVLFDGVPLRDHVDIAPAEFYERLASSTTLPTTSQPTPDDFLACYRELREAGFAVRAVPLGAIEAGGGSLRCCIGEIY